MEGGKRRVKKAPTKTAERIAIKGKTRIVYRGSRGAAYVRMNGKMVTLRSIQSAR